VPRRIASLLVSAALAVGTVGVASSGANAVTYTTTFYTCNSRTDFQIVGYKGYTSCSKIYTNYEVRGLFSASVLGPPGTPVYTQWFSKKGTEYNTGLQWFALMSTCGIGLR
jgi:hypothetical protein